MSYEYENNQDRLELSNLKIGDVVTLVFGRTAGGRQIEELELEVIEHLPESIKVLAKGGPMEWEDQMEAEILPEYLGSIAIKPTVTLGRRLQISFYDPLLRRLQEEDRAAVELENGLGVSFSEIAEQIGLDKANEVLDERLGKRIGTLPEIVDWGVETPQGRWVQW